MVHALCSFVYYTYYIALREAKAIIDEMVKKRGTRVSQFTSKEKITSFTSTSLVPPMKWAVNRYVKLLHIACSSLLSVHKGTLE